MGYVALLDKAAAHSAYWALATKVYSIMSRILLADDDLSIRQFLTGALEKSGHVVTACADGLDAWQAFETAPADAPYDLLLTDIVMPGLDGMELSIRIRSQQPDIKIVYITGFAAVAADISKSDAKLVSKPFHLGKLTQEINDLLRS